MADRTILSKTPNSQNTPTMARMKQTARNQAKRRVTKPPVRRKPVSAAKGKADLEAAHERTLRTLCETQAELDKLQDLIEKAKLAATHEFEETLKSMPDEDNVQLKSEHLRDNLPILRACMRDAERQSIRAEVTGVRTELEKCLDGLRVDVERGNSLFPTGMDDDDDEE